MPKGLFNILFHRPSDAHDGINLRRWFIFYAVYLIVLAAGALICLASYDRHPSPLFLRVWLVTLYLFYLSLCCTFFPAPTAWIVLLMASPLIALVPPQWLVHHFAISPSSAGWLAALATVVIVACVGALGTTMANLNEYHIFTLLLRFGRARRIRQTGLYRRLNRYFIAGPFVLMTAVGFFPIPVDIIRWLAISNRYRRDHYALASFLGRFLRYGLMAVAATCLRLSWRSILIIQIAVIVLIALRYLSRLLKGPARLIAPVSPDAGYAPGAEPTLDAGESTR